MPETMLNGRSPAENQKLSAEELCLHRLENVKMRNEKQIKSRFSLNPLLQPVVQYTGYLVHY